jgi:transcriptional regulator with XRE-family HTH domain
MTTSDELDAFATWVEELMRGHGYDIDSPRGGGKSRLADEAGVHRAAVSRLLQRQSMPDLETTRRLARVLGVPVRDMLIRSGRLTAEELPLPTTTAGGSAGKAASATGGPQVADGRQPTLEELAEVLGVPAGQREVFVKVVGQFLPEEAHGEVSRPGKPVVSD